MGTVERERRFLVQRVPDEVGDLNRRRLRQGYLSATGDVAIRVRDVDGADHRFTVKGGRGAVRTEVEWTISPEEFAALWPLTAGRRIVKVRRRLPVGSHVAELDVYGGDLAGHMLVEVEFDSDDEMSQFEPPAWFGTEVTNDDRYSNASLALVGWPDHG